MDPSVLIREVRKRPLLWDQKNISYHNRTLADQEWNTVAKILGERKEVAKQKWKSLRDNYRKELKKYKRMEGIYSDEPPLPKWSRFQEMSFLTGAMSSAGNDEPLNAADLVAVSLIKREGDDSSVEMEENKFDESRLTIEPVAKQEESPFLQRRESYPNPRWSAQYLSDDNGDLHFLKSLLPFMKMLPTLKKLSVRSEFHSLLIKEITELQNQENHSAEKNIKLENEEDLTMDESVSSQSLDQ